MAISELTKRALQQGLASSSAGNEIATLLDELDNDFDARDVVVLTEQVTLTNAVSEDMSSAVPAGAVILAVQARIDTAITGDGTGDDGLVDVGIGNSSDPNAYIEFGALAANTKGSTLPTQAPLASATTLGVYAIDGSGDAVTEKFVAGSLVTITVTYATAKDLEDYSG